MSQAHIERTAFRKRLLASLASAGMHGITAARLSREFNHRFSASISTPGARKWLSGEAIPVQAKLHDLAVWLQVSPHWLRYGDLLPDLSTFDSMPELSARSARVLSDFLQLTEENKAIADGVIGILLAAQPHRKRNASPGPPASAGRPSLPHE